VVRGGGGGRRRIEGQGGRPLAPVVPSGPAAGAAGAPGEATWPAAPGPVARLVAVSRGGTGATPPVGWPGSAAVLPRPFVFF